MLNISLTFSQNKYLSFTEGIKDKVTKQNTLPNRIFANFNIAGVEIDYQFTGAYISEKQVKKTTYNYLHIEGFAKMRQVGAPALPVHNEIIAIPRGAKGKVVILNAEFREYSGYMIHPALEPARDTEGAPSPKFEKDPKIYSADEFFPENIVKITNTGISRGTPLVYAEIRPVQFNPVTGKIRVYTNIKYKIIPQGGENSFNYISDENSLHYTNMLKRQVINSESIPDGISLKNHNKSKDGEKNYIIITHSQYLTQANLLADWKRQLGYSVEVVSQASWTASQVKTEVHNRYSAWTPKPDYVVIIGDHTGSYAVPGEIHQDPNYNEDFATDLYVVCMDGGSDHIPDMARGRISVSSSSEATVVINKIINYEKTPTTNAGYYTDILNCAQYQDVEDTEPEDGYSARRFCHTSEEIRDYLQNNYSYNSTRVYNTETSWDVTDLHYDNGYYSDGQLLPAELRNVSFNWSGSSSDITSAVNTGKFLVFHRDHGYTGGSGWHLPNYTTSTMTSLTNGDMLPVVFSMNCHTGEFQLDNCFAEKFVRMNNKGAVGVVAAAYYSYSGYNDALSEGMIDAIWSDPGLHPDFGSAGNGGSYTNGVGNDIYTMGDVVNQGLHAMVQNYYDNTYTHELFHYFGDPAMKIWTTNPNNNAITATHDATVDVANTSFSISGSTAGATATFVYENELISETVFDGSGNGTLSYSISESGGTVILTISKHNCKPYTADLAVTGSILAAPENLVATVTNVNDVGLTWDEPTGSSYGTPEWFSYTTMADCTNLNWPIPERVSLFDNADFSFTYPAQITKVSHGFYEDSSHPWPDATFHFKIYGADGSTLLYESGDIEAVNETEIEHTLSSPIEVSGDFYVGIVPVDASGHPSSLTENVGTGNSHSYYGSAGSWSLYDDGTDAFEYMTRVYLADQSGKEHVVSTMDINTGNNVNLKKGKINYNYVAQISENDRGNYNIIKSDVKATHSGYKVYRNNNVITTIPNISTTSYSDDDVAAGNYNYHVTATYTSPTGESGASNIVPVTILSAPVGGTATASSNSVCSGSNTTITLSGSTGTIQWIESANGTSGWANVSGGSGSTSTTYTTANLTVENYYRAVLSQTGYSDEYSNIVHITIDYNPVAPTSVSVTQTEICSGDNTELNYSGGSGDTFKWYTGSCGGTEIGTGNNLSIAPTVTTIYYGRWENVCGASSCESVTVTVTDATAITTQPVSVNANAGDNVTFSVVAEGSNLSYQWQFNSADITGETADSYIINNVQVSDAGNYDVVVNGDCGNVTSDIAVLTVASSVEDLSAYGINIYPNPSDGTFRIEIENKEKTVDVSISDMTGKLVYSNKLNTFENHIIKLHDVSKGIYFIKINLGDKSVVSKLIIQ